MNLFFDTSALAKYFHEEPGTERVVALIEDPDHTVWLSELASIEFASAMHRKFREEALSQDQQEQALAGFNETLQTFRVVPLSSLVAERAKQLIARHGRTCALRTLDALHLAAYTILAETDWQFVVADDRLYAAADREGCALTHPLRDATNT